MENHNDMITVTTSRTVLVAGSTTSTSFQLSQLLILCKHDPIGRKNDYDRQIRRLKSEFYRCNYYHHQ